MAVRYDTKRMVQEALDAGFSQAGELNMSALVFMPEVREMCIADRCHQYGKNRRCPPGCGSLEEASKCAAQYIYGLIVQTIGKTEDDFNVDTIQSASEKYKNSLKHTGGDTVKSIAAFFFSDSVWTFIGFCGICLYCQTAERRKCRMI